jgi:hypothetical protein
VIEIEGSPATPEAVLIDKGSEAGLRRGLEGRLYDAGQEIGRIEVVEIYPEGARAEIRGTLSAPVTPATRAKIDIPLDGTDSPPEEP